jgi:hypothetical protein
VNIYLVAPRASAEGFGGYDCFSGFVVVAESPEWARAALTRCADECRRPSCRKSWRHEDGAEGPGCVRDDEAVTEVTLIGRDSPLSAGVVLESFHAG